MAAGRVNGDFPSIGSMAHIISMKMKGCAIRKKFLHKLGVGVPPKPIRMDQLSVEDMKDVPQFYEPLQGRMHLQFEVNMCGTCAAQDKFLSGRSNSDYTAATASTTACCTSSSESVSSAHAKRPKSVCFQEAARVVP